MAELDRSFQVDAAPSNRAMLVQPHAYRAYGLALSSDLVMPELEQGTPAAADVTLRLRPIDLPLPVRPAGTRFEFGPDRQYLAWLGVARYLISGTGAIDVDPAPSTSEQLVRLPLLGGVMAVLLHLRGLLVLHASAVAVGSRSAIFVGDKQAGKSTMAAAMIGSRHRLLADDVLALDFSRPDGPIIMPGYPQLKLERDVARDFLGDAATPMPAILPGYEKRQHRLTHRFSHKPVRPTSIYLLSRGPAASITPLSTGDGLTSLIRFSYIARFGMSTLAQEAAGRHLKQCAALVGAARVARLDVPYGVDRLRQVVRLVEDDVGRVPSDGDP